MARKIHTTREGDRKPISAMGDDHLTNTCGIAHRICMELRTAALQSNTSLDTYLAGVDPIDPREAAEKIAEVMEEFHPYFLEAYLRGLKGPQKYLQNIYNREGASNVFLPQIPSHLEADVVEE